MYPDIPDFTRLKDFTLHTFCLKRSDTSQLKQCQIIWTDVQSILAFCLQNRTILSSLHPFLPSARKGGLINGIDDQMCVCKALKRCNRHIKNFYQTSMTFLNFDSLNTSPQAMEYILNNIAFVSLLIMTIWHWARLIYSLQFPPAIIGTVGIAIANLSLSLLLEIRWVESGHFPLSNLYESLLFLAWGFTTFHLLVEQLTKVQFVGVVTAPVALLITGFAGFSLPKEMQRATALIPALQSNWLMMHVTIMMMSYVALLGGSLLAIAFLVVNLYTQQKNSCSLSLQSDGLKTEPNATDGIPSSITLMKPSSLAEGRIERLSVHSRERVQEFPDLETDALMGGTAPSKASLSNTFFGFRHPEGLEGLSKGRVPLSTMQQFESKLRAHADHSLAPSSSMTLMKAGGGQRTPEIRTDNQLVESQIQLNDLTERRLGLKYEPSLGFDSFVRTSPAVNRYDTNTSTIAQTLDNLSYRTLGFGFPLLTIGILSGAVWANEAWGSYWSWDPKETWALITWLVFAIYLHTRLTKGWKGTGPALIATGGFVVVWICYLGVNLLGTGLHSYGWFQRS